jgi:hypothetical protein
VEMPDHVMEEIILLSMNLFLNLDKVYLMILVYHMKLVQSKVPKEAVKEEKPTLNVPKPTLVKLVALSQIMEDFVLKLILILMPLLLNMDLLMELIK